VIRSRCPGFAAKILHSEDGGAGATASTSPATHGLHTSELEARIIQATTRPVALVRPAVLDGGALALPGHALESGASCGQVGLPVLAPSEMSPSLCRNCNLCLQSATSPGRHPSGNSRRRDHPRLKATGARTTRRRSLLIA
jgi:hypothetical protein